MPPKRTTSTKPTRRKAPKIGLHKPTGQAYIRLNGRMIYCGRHDDAASHARAHRLLAEAAVNGGTLPAPKDDTRIAEVCARYTAYARGYYKDDLGQPTGALADIALAVRPLLKLYGTEKAASLGPLALRAIRQGWIADGLCRSTINSRVRILQRLFRWAASMEIVPVEVAQGLATVEGLRAYRSEAKEVRRVEHVHPAHVDAIRPFVSTVLWAAIGLQRFTGARSSELLGLRPCDIDKSGDVWIATIHRHKNNWRGKTRKLYLGAQAQAAIRPMMEVCGPFEPLFSPKRATRMRYDAAQGHRRADQRPNARKTDRVIRDAYDAASYGRAVQAGIIKCNEARQAQGLAKIPRWTPHQLRHLYAYEARRALGLEFAQSALGHASAQTTEIYAAVDGARAAEVARAIG